LGQLYKFANIFRKRKQAHAHTYTHARIIYV
jgi:hypothetical protein